MVENGKKCWFPTFFLFLKYLKKSYHLEALKGQDCINKRLTSKRKRKLLRQKKRKVSLPFVSSFFRLLATGTL